MQRCLRTTIALEILCLVLEEAPSSQCLEASEYRDTYTHTRHLVCVLNGDGLLFLWTFSCSHYLCIQVNLSPYNYSNADGRFNLGRSYNDDVLLLPLPDGVDACDISTLTIWCRPATAIFNRVTLTRSVFVSSILLLYYKSLAEMQNNVCMVKRL